MSIPSTPAIEQAIKTIRFHGIILSVYREGFRDGSDRIVNISVTRVPEKATMTRQQADALLVNVIAM